MPLLVRFWGTRGSIPTPGPRTQRYGGNTSCVEIRTERARIVCDGGTGLRELGVELARESDGPLAIHVFFSHPHWDHIQGFPFFTPAYDPKNTILIYGGGGGDDHVHGLLSGQMDSRYFPVQFSDLGAIIVPGHFEGDRAIAEDVTVTRFVQRHPGGSAGYVFESDGGKVVYSTDNELDALIEDLHLPERDPQAQRTFPDRILEPYRGADLLIADGQYEEEEYPRKAGWGHPRAQTATDLAVAAGVKRLALYHHDPMQSDADMDEKVRRCAERAKRFGSELVVFGAREGLTLRVP